MKKTIIVMIATFCIYLLFNHGIRSNFDKGRSEEKSGNYKESTKWYKKACSNGYQPGCEMIASKKEQK